MDAAQKADLLRAAYVRKGPQNELTDIRVQEIGFVDHAANARRFVVRKSMDKIKMSPAQKAAAQSAAADLCDKANSMLAIIGGADEDEAAGDEGNETVGALAKAMSDMAGGMAEQFGKKKPKPNATASEDASGAQVSEEEKAAGKKPFPGAAPPFGADGKPAKDEETKKAQIAKAELDNFTAATVTISAARSQLYDAMDAMKKDPAATAEKLKQIIGMLDNAAQFMSASGMSAAAEKSAAVEKAGKVLSAKNTALVKACMDALKALASAAGLQDDEAAVEKGAEVAKAGAPVNMTIDGEVLAKAVTKAIEPLKAEIAEIKKADEIAKAAQHKKAAEAHSELPGSNAAGRPEPGPKEGRLTYDPNDLSASFGPDAQKSN